MKSNQTSNEELFRLIIEGDINQRRQAEKILRNTMRELETQKRALDLTAIVAETDPQGCITYVNDAFCRISKYTREELIGRDHRDVVNSGYHSKEFWKEMWTTVGQGKVWRADVKNRAKDWSFYWVDATIVPFMGLDGKPKKYLAIRSLITERKKMEEALSEAADKMKQLIRLKDEFVAMASHELRTPLAAMKEATSLIAEEVLGKTTPEQKKFLVIIGNSIDRLVALTNNMLDLEKIEAGRMELRRRKVSIKDLIETALEDYRSLAENRNFKVGNINVPDVFAHPSKILQVLGNLLSNAVKFTKEGGTIVLGAKEQNGGEVAISIEDDGPGIAKDDIPKLFQKFSQVGRNEKRPRGTGLGLTLSKEIVEIHKGKFFVTSELGRGSQFTFTLPVYTVKFAMEEYFAEQLENVRRMNAGGIGILVIAIEIKEHLEETILHLKKKIHPTDTALKVEADQIVILAAVDAKGAASILKRLPDILEKSPGSFRVGTALYPNDGMDIDHLLIKAKANRVKK